MKTPELAASLVEASVREARVPVTVKIRRGFAAGENTAADFAARMEQAGAAAVAVHGRTASQLYTGQADWSTIDEVAERVSVPVIGSGDVFSAEDAARMLSDTAADAVFIARGTYGNPWVFGDARALALEGTPVPERSARERIEVLREHLTLLHETQPFMARARAFLPAGISRGFRTPPHGAARWCSARPTRSLWRCSTRSRPTHALVRTADKREFACTCV